MSNTFLRFAVALPAMAFVLVYCGPRDNSSDFRSERLQQSTAAPGNETVKSTASLELPITFARHVGDLEGMNKRHVIRVLVVPSHSGFFDDRGIPHGIFYEAFDELQRFANQKLRTGNLKVNFTFIPVRLEQLEHALLEGIGDVVGYGVVVTPEREKLVLFTTPIDSNVKQVIVTGPKAPPIASLEDLSGKEVYVNPLTVYYENLQRLSKGFEKAGRPPILVKAADPNLTDEDLLKMINAGLIPATVTLNIPAEFWSKVFPRLTLHQDTVLKEEGQLAFATRKDSPELRRLLDEFVRGRQMGTSFGNTLLRRYLQNTKWARDVTSAEEMRKFQEYVRYFEKYAAEYDFDYLMLVAQGYQESGLDQNRKNPSGTVGIMQVMPKYAAAPPISIPNVEHAETNIQAGAKMLRNIAETYFNDDKLDATNDPNQWFGNVELLAAKDVGQETVQYVGNIYKYYIAYKLTLEEAKVQR